MISAELDRLYRRCLDCEQSGQEFDQTSANWGECLPRYSLRGTGRPPDLEQQERERKRIGDEVTARELERQAEQRRRRVRNWLDSDVSGDP
jgi:hypothetical protein